MVPVLKDPTAWWGTQTWKINLKSWLNEAREMRESRPQASWSGWAVSLALCQISQPTETMNLIHDCCCKPLSVLGWFSKQSNWNIQWKISLLLPSPYLPFSPWKQSLLPISFLQMIAYYYTLHCTFFLLYLEDCIMSV